MERAVVSLGTATPGGGFPAYGQAFADTINEIETTLEVRPQNTEGSTENVPLLEAGKLDLGLVDVAHRLARALHRGEGAIAGRLAQAGETTAANTIAAAPSRGLIHPGVLRYFEEAGIAA